MKVVDSGSDEDEELREGSRLRLESSAAVKQGTTRTIQVNDSFAGSFQWFRRFSPLIPCPGAKMQI